LSGVVRKRLSDYPEHRIIFLCNEEYTVEPFRRNGVEALFCNQNAFINENVFTILSSQPKVYDAVYSASMTPYKRFELAAEVSSLMILTYRWAGHYQSDYEKKIRVLLKNNANWIKDTYSDDDKVTTPAMVRLYNQARVGLCLSKAEGGMFASMEYLLCGLPVVTTRSVGGRDSFWDDSYVIIVDDDAESVAQGVSELIKMDVSAELVRRETLVKIQFHRQRLLEYLKDTALLDIPWEPGGGGGIMDVLDLMSVSLELQN
jgi:glycosyltransferase involved in cell wall biosynthesis